MELGNLFVGGGMGWMRPLWYFSLSSPGIGSLWRCFPHHRVTFGHIAMEEDNLPFDTP